MARKEGPRARLGWLLDGEFTCDPRTGPNRRAADAVRKRIGEKFDDDAEALLVGFVMLAEAVDADPTNAALWGQYRAAEDVVRKAASDGDGDDFSKLMARLSAEVSDTTVP